MDLAVALPLIPLLGPLLAVTAVAFRVTGDRGPVLHRAVRIGEGGRTFTLYKLRSMRVGSSGPGITTDTDPRVTVVGRFLRRWKIDELPQLWNVARGEMSIVGPRPEDPRYVDWGNPLHARVFVSRPGITGLAQVRFSDEQRLLGVDDPESFYVRTILPAKLALDAEYLERQSVRTDVRIIRETVRALLGRGREQRPPQRTAPQADER